MLARRGFLTGLVSLMVAPAIVKASNIMPIKSYFDEDAARFAIESISSYNFIDNQAIAIRYTGKILIYMIPHIYNEAKE